MSTNYLKINKDGTTVVTTELPSWGSVSDSGDYYIDGLWYDKTGLEYTEQFTYASKEGKLLEIEVVDGTPVDIHYNEFAPTLVEKTIQVSHLVGKTLQVSHLVGNEPNSLFVKNALNASGDAPIYACRAWVNFNGAGTVAIRASGNVSSITDNGTGDYTVNFTTAMPDANYAFSGFSSFFGSTSVAGNLSFGNNFSMDAQSLRIKSADSTTGSPGDSSYITVTVFK